MMAVDDGQRRAAIIDIGSNSVRLVVYSGAARAPQPVFNEKLMAGLGASLATTGCIEKGAYTRAIAGLARFRALTEAMGIGDVRCVATAAVRDASNGVAFLADVMALGLEVELLSGQDEARASGFGVISAIPDANGIVADLGGGSLELVRVRYGQTMHHSSFPFGVLRVDALLALSRREFARTIQRAVKQAGWPGDDRNLPLYLVGGSWRALARFEMLLAQDPMPVVSGHIMEIAAVERLNDRLASQGAPSVSKLPGMSTARVQTLPAAAAVLVPLAKQLRSSHLIVSTSGLREGLLYQDLALEVRAQDPLLAAAAAEGRRFARFGSNGDVIDGWLAPLFADDDSQSARLRLAACLLSEVATTANPDFRTDRACEMGLHGQWLGIDLSDRRVLAQALYTSVGGQGRPAELNVDTAVQARMDRAVLWGLAIRLAQRLSGGTTQILQHSRIDRSAIELTLTIGGDEQQLIGEQVNRRLAHLAAGLGLVAKVAVTPV